MKKLNSFSFLLALLLLSSLSVSAQRTFVSSIAERNATYLTIANQDAAKYFFSNASNQMIDVETNLSLNVKSDRTWCKPSVNGKKVTIAVDPNTEAPGRTATVTVYGKDNKSRTVAVTQLGTGSGILINEKEINLTNYRLDFSLGITGNILFTIDVPDWINESAQTPRIGFQEYTFSAKEITEAIGERRGFIVIKTANNEVPEIKIPVSQVYEGYPRFAVISDVHFGNSQGEGPMVKVPKALKNLTSHGKLDALFIVGDLTDGGTAAQYTQFVQVMSNPANFTNPVDTMIYMMGNHDNYATQTNYINGLKPLNNGKPYPMDQYIVIKGYPFITISQRSGDNTDASNAAVGEKSYPKEVQEKLRTWMKKAAEECPGKPIFVFTHVPPKHTCYSSWPGEGDGTSWPTWSMKTLNPILNEYPQAVVFGGHSHFPIGDPRSIHQGVNPGSDKQNFFTGINTGSTTYSEIHKPSVYEGIHPDRYAYVTEGMILSVQPNNDVKIQRYDTYRNEEMHPEKPWMLKAPHDGTMFRYADKRDAGDTNPNGLVLRNGLPAPVFADNAAVTLDASATNSVSVTFPQATDDEYVFRYRVEVKNSEGNTVSEVYQFSYFYLNSEMPATLTTTVGGLSSNTTYTVKVTALDSYDNASTSLVSGEFATGTYTPTPGSSKPAESTLILDVAFNENGT
ncbi:MAG: metallophosphoesterase, partial [Dysgonamonadaceae bacterium]|nr:metallophosphoesterase [Dysgonamonadaceae bacterium]